MAFGQLIERLRQRGFFLMSRDDGQSHQNLGLVIRSQAEAMISHGDDAGPARLDHHDANLLPKSHLGQPMNDVRRAVHLDHMTDFASRHQFQRDDVFQDKAPERDGILGPQLPGTTEFGE